MSKQKNYFKLIILINTCILIVLISISCAARSNESNAEIESSSQAVESFEYGQKQLKYPPGMSVTVGDKKTFIAQGTSSWTIELGDGKFQSTESDSEGPIGLTENGNYTLKAKAFDEVFLNFEHVVESFKVNIFHSYSVIEPVDINEGASFTVPEGIGELVYEIYVKYQQGDVHYAVRIIVEDSNTDESEDIEIQPEEIDTEEESDTLIQDSESEETEPEQVEQTEPNELDVEELQEDKEDIIRLEDLEHKYEYDWMTREVPKIDPHTRKFGVIETPLEGFELVKRSDRSQVYFGEIKHDYSSVYYLLNNVAQVHKDDKYGYVNAKGQQLTPIVFDELNPGYTEDGVSDNVKYGNRYLHLDLVDGIITEYLPYDDSMADQYSDVIDLDMFEIVIVDGRIVVNGQTEDLGFRFPIILLDSLEFELYEAGKYIGPYQGKITRGDYEGDLIITFPNHSSYPYTATLSIGPNEAFNYEPITVIENLSSYYPLVKTILEESNIGNSEILVKSALKGDFLGDGKASALVLVEDGYNRLEDLDLIYDTWDEKAFVKDEFALFDMIIFIEDINDLSNYDVLYFDYYQYLAKLSYPYVELREIINIDHDPKLELIIDLFWYEYGEYIVLNPK